MQPWLSLAQYARVVVLPSNGQRLHTYDSGGGQASEAPPVVLVHGVEDEADTWRHVFEPLARRQRVIAMDLPGFGRSATQHRALSISFFGSTLVQLLDVLSITRAVLIGNSLGGIIAHIIALTHAERVAAVILVDGVLSPIAQKVELPMLLGLLPFYGEWSYNRLRKDPRMAYETLRPYYADLDAMPQQDRDFLFQRVNERVWSDTQRAAYLSVLRKIPVWMVRQAQRLAMRPLSMPGLIVWGEQDHILPLESAHALVAAQSKLQLAVIPSAGHLPHQEQPSAFLQAAESVFQPT